MKKSKQVSRPLQITGAAAGKRAGFATVAVLILISLAVTAVIIGTDMSLTQVRMAARSQNRQAALTLAEAGIEDAIEYLRYDRAFTGGTGTLYTDPPDNLSRFGNYQTTVTALDPRTRKIVSVGTTPNGTTTSLIAIVDLPKKKLGDVPIRANRNVDINGAAVFSTLPGSLHIADIRSNGNIRLGSGSLVDGTLFAAGTVDGPSYDAGRVFAPSIASAPLTPFPTDAEMLTLKSDLRTAAQTGTHYSRISTGTTITAPAYIAGDIDLSGDEVLTITGMGIVYVTGDIRLNDRSVLKNGATLAVGGTVIQTDNSVYGIMWSAASTPTLIAFNEPHRIPGIALSGGSPMRKQGVVIAVQGGIRFTPDSVFVGALFAGGTDGDILGMGDLLHLFPQNMRSSLEVPDSPKITFLGEP